MKPNGGPAFPAQLRAVFFSDAVKPADLKRALDDCGELDTKAGMSLRDYFAAHAPTMHPEYLKGLPVNPGEDLEAWMARRMAIWALKFADAMLAERERT